MTKVEAGAPAKVNLTLHVTGQRGDGYHLLQSLVVFADVNDRLTAIPAADISLTVSGPFSQGVPSDASNLVLRAATVLRQLRGGTQGAAIKLEKHLPHAAGIGSGSSDAATALTMLAKMWGVDPLPAITPEVLELGADVPACLRAPRATIMGGIGDTLQDAPTLPDCALVLVNPRVEVPTGPVFNGLASKTNPPMTPLPDGISFDGFSDWLRAQRNDLLSPARRIAPQIEQALARLDRMAPIAVSGLSGSGATCWGLTRTMADARQVARALQISEMGWWVAPAQVMRATT